jgi:hypothetical protein
MSDNWNDAKQEYENENSSSTAVVSSTGEVLENGAILTDLIKLNYDFPVEPNIELPKSYNIYIWNNNDNGEIRFYTKDAKNNNDYNQNYFTGNYTNPRLNHNTKIGKDGKLYYYHNYTSFNPTKLSGWYEIDSNFNGVEQQLTIIDIFIGTLNVGQIAIQSQLNTVITSNTTQFAVIDSVLAQHEVRLDFIEFSPIEGMNIFDWDSTAYDANTIFQTTRRALQENMKKGGGNFTRLRQRTVARNRSRLSSIITKIFSDSLTTIAVVGFTAGLYGVIRELLDKRKAENYSDELMGISDNLSQLSVSATADTINHTRITIVSGNTGFTSVNTTYIVSVQREAVIVIYINSSSIASVVNVEQYGSSDFSVSETIIIPKASLGGGTGGDLVLSVASLGTLKEWTELRATYLQNKITGIQIKNRRKQNVIGADDIDTTQFTTTNVSYTDTTDPINETITYKQLKSRLNLLPTGTSDVNVYTMGNIGIGTTGSVSTTKLDIIGSTKFMGMMGIGASPPLVGDAFVPLLKIYSDLETTLYIRGANTTGSASIEFGLGDRSDTTPDFRLANLGGGDGLYLQYQNNSVVYNGVGSDLVCFKPALTTFYKDTTFNGKVSIGNPIHATHKVDVNGDINVSTGFLFKVNGSAYKPAGAVLADTATDLATGSILSVGKGGTGASTFTANGLLIGNTTSAITQNASLTYTTSTLNAPNMNVPTGGKYKINSIDLSYNDLTDKLTAGTNIAISAGNVISATSGTTYTGGNGITITGSSIALSGSTTGSFNVLGNVNLSTALGTSSYKLNVEGDVNVSGIGKKFYVNNVPIVSSYWSASGTTIEYNTGSVGIGTPALSYKLNVAGTINCSAIYINDIQFTNLFTGNATNIYYAGGTLFGASGTATSVVEIQKANSGFGTSISMLGTNFDASNGLRISQNWVSAGNIQYDIIHKNSGTDTTAMSIRGGRVGIGTFPATLNKFEVLGKSLFSDNVGIGTVPSTTATTKLDVNGDTRIVGKTTSGGLSISGTTEFLTANPSIPTIPTALSITPAPTSTFTPSSSTTRCAILTYQGTGTGTTYSVVIPAGGMLCDILMVGGGGSGGRDIGAGGGGGAVLYATNVLLKQDTYSLVVGRGAVSTSGEAKGQSTTGFGAILLGGGSAGDLVWNQATYANDGGSGAGGKSIPDEWGRRGGRPIVGGSKKGGILCDGTLYEGKVGGYGVQQTTAQVVSSGGGGAGAVGGNGQQSGTSGGSAVGSSGGAGVSNTILDTSYFWGGGGGGGSYAYTTPPNGGAGGGGAGQNNNGGGITATGNNGASSFFAVGTAINGINGTGGGGGGTGYTTASAGSGGAGVIIIRYKLPINNNQTIDFLPTNTNGTMTTKQGMIGANYKIQASTGSTILDALTIDATTGSLAMFNNSFAVKGTNDTLITNNCGIGIDPSSTYKLNVNGDLNINGNIYQNGFIATTGGFQATICYNLRYTGNTNFLITTRAKNCNLQIYTQGSYGHYIFRDMAVGERRGSVNGGINNGNWTYFVPYITYETDDPNRPFKVWIFNGSDTNVLVMENWYN